MHEFLLPSLDLNPSPALAFGIPGGWEWIVLLVIGLLIFGRRLPEVGRWLGQGIVEFKRGIKGIGDEIEEESARPADRLPEEPSAPADARDARTAKPPLAQPRTAEPARDETTFSQEMGVEGQSERRAAE